jgi:hypothetical protein
VSASNLYVKNQAMSKLSIDFKKDQLIEETLQSKKWGNIRRVLKEVGYPIPLKQNRKPAIESVLIDPLKNHYGSVAAGMVEESLRKKDVAALRMTLRLFGHSGVSLDEVKPSIKRESRENLSSPNL